MIVHVNELSGVALDWAVAKCEKNWVLELSSFIPNHDLGRMNYSTDWSQGGPLIEREGISVCYDVELCNMDGHEYWATQYSVGSGEGVSFGPTPLVAAMRCYVASKLGDSVDIPDELL